MTDYNLTDQNNMRLCHRCRSSMHTLKTVPISLCRHTYCWLLKAYYFWGRKINLSGISPARRRRSGPNSVYVDMSRGGVTTFRKFWARLTHFGQNGGWDESRGARVFCGNPEEFRQLRNGRFSTIWTRNVVRCPVAESGKTFAKLFILGVISPQNRKSVKHAPHSEQATGQGMHCREILFTPRCSPRVREFPKSVNFFLRRTVAELQSVKVAKFSDFGVFSIYKTPAYSPGITSQNDSDFSMW